MLKTFLQVFTVVNQFKNYLKHNQQVSWQDKEVNPGHDPVGLQVMSIHFEDASHASNDIVRIHVIESFSALDWWDNYDR